VSASGRNVLQLYVWLHPIRKLDKELISGDFAPLFIHIHLRLGGDVRRTNERIASTVTGFQPLPGRPDALGFE